MASKKILPHKDHVFVNCPFDPEYKPLFDSIIFAIHYTGFIARCALEVIDSGSTRLNKIIRIIEQCKYGIHDISRIELSAGKNLPRFNMPYECGLFWGCLHYGNKAQKGKRIIVLDSEAGRYRDSISDISGQDIQVHHNSPEIMIDKIRVWLNIGSGKTNIPGGKAIWEYYQQFQNDLPLILSKAKITRAELDKPEYFADYIAFIVEWLTQKKY
ncbi:MAG: hypothetical protein ABI760_06725 [Ferruginibacter sp.]